MQTYIVILTRSAERLSVVVIGAMLIWWGIKHLRNREPPRPASGPGSRSVQTGIAIQGEANATGFSAILKGAPSGVVVVFLGASLLGLAVSSTLEITDDPPAPSKDGAGVIADDPGASKRKIRYAQTPLELIRDLSPPLEPDQYEELRTLAESLQRDKPDSDAALRAGRLCADVYKAGRLTEAQRERLDNLKSKPHPDEFEELERKLLLRRYGKELKPSFLTQEPGGLR